MVMVVLLAVALIAAPAIAQNGESTTPDPPVDGPPDDGPGASILEPPPSEPPPTEEPPAPEPPPAEEPPPAPELPAPGPPPAQELPILEPPAPEESPTPEPPGPGDEGPVPDTGTDYASPGDVRSTGPSSDEDDGPNGRTRDDDDDEINEDESADDDEFEAEAREDRIADRLLAQLRDGRNDDDDDDDDDEIEQRQDQDADSGDVDQDADVLNTGDNVNQCVGILQVANTGNAQNATGVTQYDSEADEIELEDGSQITLTPQLVVDCRQIILQIVRGERPNESKLSRERLREVIQPRSGSVLANRTGAGVVVPSGRSGITAAPKVLSASSAGRPAGQPRNSATRSLPRTGGSYATLLGLGTGVLLVGGGLLVRRLAR